MIRLELERARRFAVVALFVVGAFLRCYQLDRYPLGVHQDELSNIYDGYSLAETGADRFGDSHPVILRAFGEHDYRPALYAWLAAVPQRFTGFSVIAGRAPAAVLGIVSLFLVYGFARNMAGQSYAFFVLLFAVLSPLHVQLSRIAHEGGILPSFFMILILFLWQTSATKDFRSAHLLALGFATGFSANAYQATRLTAPLLALAIAIDIFRYAPQRLRAFTAFAAAALLGAVPQVVVLLREPQHFFARAQMAVVTANDPLSYVAIVLYNCVLNIGPSFLFVPRVVQALTVARLNPAEILFFYSGLFGLAFLPVRSPSRARFYVYIAFVIALLPAAVTIPNPSGRSFGIAVLTPLISGAGVILLGSLVRSKQLRKRLYYPITIATVVLAFAAITYRYARSEFFRESSFQKIAVDMARKAGTYQDQYDAIFIQRYVSVPYIYLAAFAPMTPREFQRMPKRLYSDGMDQFMQLGKYHFVETVAMPRKVHAYRGRPGRFLFVAPSRFTGLSTIDSVSFGKQKLYFQTF